MISGQKETCLNGRYDEEVNRNQEIHGRRLHAFQMMSIHSSNDALAQNNKSPQGAFVMVGPRGLEPRTKGL